MTFAFYRNTHTHTLELPAFTQNVFYPITFFISFSCKWKVLNKHLQKLTQGHVVIIIYFTYKVSLILFLSCTHIQISIFRKKNTYIHPPNFFSMNAFIYHIYSIISFCVAYSIEKVSIHTHTRALFWCRYYNIIVGWWLNKIIILV